MTTGHRDMILRASRLFDEIVVVIMNNREKTSLFTLAERKKIAELTLGDIDNVSVDVSSGMFYEYAASINAVAVVKGVRNTDDYLYELWQAEYNRSKNPDCELVLLPAYGEMTGISSTLARSLLASGKDISGIVSDKAAVYIGRLMKRKKADAET
jgi:pantetheine-phosphate adenylyltransferase